MQAPEPARIIDTPLAPLHQQAGAKMGEWFGCALPDDFGDWQREYWFAHKSVALLDKIIAATFRSPDRTASATSTPSSPTTSRICRHHMATLRCCLILRGASSLRSKPTPCRKVCSASPT